MIPVIMLSMLYYPHPSHRYAGACTAAAFLSEFVTSKKWAHIDIAGVMETQGEIPYLPKGMAGKYLLFYDF